MDKHEFTPEKRQESREARIEHLESDLEKQRERLEDYKQVVEARKEMFEISIEQLEPVNVQWEYQDDDDYIDALKRFKEGKFAMNRRNDEQQLERLKQTIEDTKQKIAELEEEMEDDDAE